MEDEFDQLWAACSGREEFVRRQAQNGEIEDHRVNETDGENLVVCAWDNAANARNPLGGEQNTWNKWVYARGK